MSRGGVNNQLTKSEHRMIKKGGWVERHARSGGKGHEERT